MTIITNNNIFKMVFYSFKLPEYYKFKLICKGILIFYINQMVFYIKRLVFNNNKTLIY